MHTDENKYFIFKRIINMYIADAKNRFAKKKMILFFYDLNQISSVETI